MRSHRQARVHKALADIRKKNRGRLSPQLIVEAARAKDHPLHKEFIWDDHVAAHKQRLDRARKLLRFVTVVVVDTPMTISSVVYVRDPFVAKRQQSYLDLSAPELTLTQAKEVVADGVERCRDVITRLRNMAMFLDQRFPGLSEQLETGLQHIVAAGARIKASRRRGSKDGGAHAPPP
jgi:hypothetical protein